MFSTLCSMIAAMSVCQAQLESPAGFTVETVKGPNGIVRQSLTPYVPREGDLVFFDDHKVFWQVLYYWAGTGSPYHMGIVVKRADGKPAILEAGPDDKLFCYLLDVPERLRKFEGTIAIRHCKVILSKERSAALTKFAEAQNGKRYAVIRFLLQGTMFRSRGPLREMFLAHTYLDRSSWICSELAVAAGTVAGLFNPNVVKANVIYPLDIVNNQRFDLSGFWEDAREWQPTTRPPRP
jgi:hypothetical protein